MDQLTKPYRECCLHKDPSRIYDLTGWDAEKKLYRLENDLKERVYVRSHEFTLISSFNEDLLRATEQGTIEIDDVKIITVEDLMAGGYDVVPIDGQDIGIPDQGQREARPCTREATRPDARTHGQKPKDGQAKSAPEASEAKLRVRELLAGAEGREQLASVASELLDETPEALIAKYAHLDNGRFRMTLGNRMVGVLKKC